MIKIRKARDADFENIWTIFHHVVKRGDTFAFDPKSNIGKAMGNHSIKQAKKQGFSAIQFH